MILNKKNFIKLTDDWHNNTIHISSVSQIMSHDAVKQIREWGQEAVPYIMRYLDRFPIPFSLLLSELTKHNPIKECNRGNSKKMLEDWKNWYNYEKSKVSRIS